eukprot:1520385-Amphidinium_carterae.1
MPTPMTDVHAQEWMSLMKSSEAKPPNPCILLDEIQMMSTANDSVQPSKWIPTKDRFMQLIRALGKLVPNAIVTGTAVNKDVLEQAISDRASPAAKD